MIKLLTSAAVLVTLIAPAAAQGDCIVNAPYTAVDQYYGFVGAALNVRAWPNGPILVPLLNGTPVQILNVDPNGGGSPWAQIVTPDGLISGWVFLPYLACS